MHYLEQINKVILCVLDFTSCEILAQTIESYINSVPRQ